MATIRLMRASDVNSALILANPIFSSSRPGGSFTHSFNRNTEDAIKWFGDSETIAEYFVAVDKTLSEPQIVGTSGLYTYTDKQDEMWLGWFCVSRLVRGFGIGQKLFDYSQERAKNKYGASVLKLWTGKHDTAAHRLYRRNGMRRVRVSSEDEKKLVFRKVL